MITPSQYENLRSLVPNRKWTSWIRSQYKPCDDEKIVIAWHTEKRRWVICRAVKEGLFKGDHFADVSALKPISMWQGPNSTYLPIDSRLVQWFRSHDTYNAKDYGTWSDRMFAEASEDSYWDDMTNRFKEMYDKHKSAIQAHTTPAREEPGKRKHFYKGCLTTPDRGAAAA